MNLFPGHKFKMQIITCFNLSNVTKLLMNLQTISGEIENKISSVQTSLEKLIELFYQKKVNGAKREVHCLCFK